MQITSYWSNMAHTFLKGALIAIVFLFSSSVYYMHIYKEHTMIHLEPRSFPYEAFFNTSKDFLVHTPGCRIRKLDPFDNSVRKFYAKVPYNYKCSPMNKEKSIFIVRENGMVSLDEDALFKQHKLKKSEIDCYFYPIFRKKFAAKPDETYAIGKKHDMIFGLPIEDDAIMVKCQAFGKEMVSSVLALTPIKPEVEEKCKIAQKDSKSIGHKLNVIVVGIDSISKLNFLRYFGHTLKFLRNDLNATELHGFTKVGDNTYPNLMPFLTGRHSTHFKSLERRHAFYDDVDLVWKKYSEDGYRTMFAEDAPNMGTFVLNRRGFKNPPTDYYTRPFSVIIEDKKLKQRTHCINYKLEMEVYFEYLRNFVHTMKDNPYFAFTFMARLTHDILENAGYADRPSYELLNDLKNDGVLNKSLLVFFSDHGIRFGKIRQTYIGKIEERMPFMFLVFPKWFLDSHPEFARSLKINQHRLTTHFDIHATLLHLLSLEKETHYTLFGQSLLTEISPERTCVDAAIAPHWCTCQSHKMVSAEDANVRQAALAVVRQLNTYLKPFFKVCVPLKLQAILDARVAVFNKDLLNVNFKEYLVTVMVTPSAAIFEATVEMRKNTFVVSEELSRINRYDSQSDCIEDSVIKKYCFCKSKLRTNAVNDEATN